MNQNNIKSFINIIEFLYENLYPEKFLNLTI